MKIRTGFVSNSSSSSFAINLKAVSEEQKEKIYNHIKEAQKINEGLPRTIIDWATEEDAWEINENEYFIMGNTNMDNFDMRTFLKEIGIDMNAVKFERY